jgi:hypothetical protein
LWEEETTMDGHDIVTRRQFVVTGAAGHLLERPGLWLQRAGAAPSESHLTRDVLGHTEHAMDRRRFLLTSLAGAVATPLAVQATRV